jgi:hypothetical protein
MKNRQNLRSSLIRLLILFFLFKLQTVWAVDFKGTDLISGSTVYVQTSAQRLTAFVFLSSQCPCSQASEKHLNDLVQEFSKNSFFNIVGVFSDQKEDPVKAEQYFKNSGLQFPVIRDVGGVLAKQLGAIKTPHVFLFEYQQGREELVYVGGVASGRKILASDELYLKNVLEHLSQNKAAPFKEKRVLGCRIQL